MTVNPLFKTVYFFPSKMATLRNKRKLAAVAGKETGIIPQEQAVSGQSRYLVSRGINYSCVWGGGGKRNREIVSGIQLNIESNSGCFVKIRGIPAEPKSPGAIRNRSGILLDFWLNEDRSANDPHPKVVTSINWSPHIMNSDPDEGSYCGCSKFGIDQDILIKTKKFRCFRLKLI